MTNIQGNLNKDFNVGHGSIASQPLELEHIIDKHISCNCNKPIQVKIKKLYNDVIVPEQATSGSAGFDLRLYIPERDREFFNEIYLEPNETVKINTGLCFELPEDHVMIICPRSSTGIKKGLMMQNTIGILDADYRGECFLFLKNMSYKGIVIEHGERICQAIIMPYPKVNFEVVEELSSTERGTGGFGSTGS